MAKRRSADRTLEALRRVDADRSHGARALAHDVLVALAGEAVGLRARPPKQRPARVRSVGRALGRTQPAMGTFREWALEWKAMARTVPPVALPGRVGRWTRRWRTQLARELPAIVRVAAHRAPVGLGTVVTISRSETVRRVLVGLPQGRSPRGVVALESRPGGEGRGLGHDLRRAGLPCDVVADAEGRRRVRSADLVLLGADAVYASGDLVHKVGTRRLAEEALRAGVPVVVVAGRSKWVDRRRGPRRLPPRFDRTPARAITEYWTDRGVRPGARARPGPFPRVHGREIIFP